jgi:glycosyltransferase involved in cell wall biosynthesis
MLCGMDDLRLIAGTRAGGSAGGSDPSDAGIVVLSGQVARAALRMLQDRAPAGHDPDVTMSTFLAAIRNVKGVELEVPGVIAGRSESLVSLGQGSVVASPRNARLWARQSALSSELLRRSVADVPGEDAGRELSHLLVVVPWLPTGGSEVLLLDILSHVRRSWSITIVTTKEDAHAMTPQFEEVAQEVFHAGNYLEPIRVFALIAGLMASRRTAVVLSSNSSAMYEFLPELKAMFPGTQFADLLHNDLAEGHISSATLASAALSRHVAVSRKVGRSLIQNGIPPARVQVVENGVDTAVFFPDDKDRQERRSALGVTDDALHLLFVGRLSAEKRAEAFLDVVREVARSAPTTATLVAEGPREHEFRRRIAAENLPVRLLSKFPRRELVHLYRTADFLVLTSDIEGMPLVVLEALACGSPVAATDVGDLRRIIVPGENGYLVDVRFPVRLAPLIVGASKLPLERRLAMRDRAARTVIEAGMDRTSMLRGYDALFADLLSPNAIRHGRYAPPVSQPEFVGHP